MGFRTLAIQKRSSEVWNLLAAVKTEFGKFGESLSAVKEKIDQASRKMEDVDVRSRAITKKLRDVEESPSNPQPLLKDLLSSENDEL
jgi:DNA recombination protein RmuC